MGRMAKTSDSGLDRQDIVGKCKAAPCEGRAPCYGVMVRGSRWSMDREVRASGMQESGVWRPKEAAVLCRILGGALGFGQLNRGMKIMCGMFDGDLTATNRSRT